MYVQLPIIFNQANVAHVIKLHVMAVMAHQQIVHHVLLINIYSSLVV